MSAGPVLTQLQVASRNCVFANAADCETCGDDGTVVDNDLNNNDICDDVENECSAPD